MQLRSYQQGAIDCVEDPFNGILVLPTGSGKSVVIAGLAQKYNEPILILQPSKEILEQNYSKIISFVENPDEVGIFSASLNQKTIKRITLATIGSIKNKEDFSQFKIVIIDECHLVNAKSGMYSRLLKFLSPKMLIGLTATPYRMHVDDYNGVTWKFLHRLDQRFLLASRMCIKIKQPFKKVSLLNLNTTLLSMILALFIKTPQVQIIQKKAF